ncbi:regulator of chromosome condensation 1/beta-lactamase-inhibitor protein II, partial [Baffinella frigidus]
VLSIATGSNFVCVLLDIERVKCWGDNSLAQLGILGVHKDLAPATMGDNLPFLDFGLNKNVKHISAGYAHSCGILQDDTVKCWGYNDDGQLGNEVGGYNTPRFPLYGDATPVVKLGTGVTAKLVSCGFYHSCIISQAGNVMCWGKNGDGQCGTPIYHGKDPATMGDNLPIVSLGVGLTAVYISAGSSHTCAILDNNMLKCWGDNSYGQLGYGHTTQKGGNTGFNDMGGMLPYVNLGTYQGNSVTVLSVSCGKWQTCALIMETRGVKCWGSVMAYGTAEYLGDEIGEMGDMLPYVDLGVYTHDIATVTVGDKHVCVVAYSDQTVRCWGDNTYGQLGLGNTN